MRRRTIRGLGVICGVAGLFGVAAGCELPFRPTLVVTTTADGNDADPGDGVCEMTVGAGDCSLRAAVQEGNAGAGALIVLPPGAEIQLTVADGDGDVDLDVESAITVEPVTPAARLKVGSGGPAVDVAEGGSFGATGLEIPRARVAGGLLLERGLIGDATTGGVVLEVTATGNAVVATSPIFSFGGSAVVANAGTFVSLHTSIRGLATTTLIDTTGSGTTTLAGTRLLRATILGSGYYPITGAPYCSGNPIVSQGWNYSRTTDCNLTATGDIAGVSYGTAGGPLGTPTLLGPTPADSPVLGAIPEGVLACGDAVPATDGACDIGWD